MRVLDGIVVLGGTRSASQELMRDGREQAFLSDDESDDLG
jgi:hypothetical protein